VKRARLRRRRLILNAVARADALDHVLERFPDLPRLDGFASALVGEFDVKKFQRSARQGPPLHIQVWNLRDDILDDAVVSCRRRADHRYFFRQQLQDANDAAIVRTEIVSPVGNAMRLVNYEQTDAVLDSR